jgi:phage tail-like protein
MTDQLAPLHVFRYEIVFYDEALAGGNGSDTIQLAGGAFAECSGLEATMEPKVIVEGGQNYGQRQRAGPVTFATVVLRRGISANHDLWDWFALSSLHGGYTYRMGVSIRVKDSRGQVAQTWRLARALPVKFKAADLNARGGEIGIEELHLAHEGLGLDLGDAQ